MSIFTQEVNQTPEEVVTNPLESLVGEDKKFKSVEDLARGKLESDAYITRLKEELDHYKVQATQAQTLDEIVTKIREASAQSPQNPVVTPTQMEDEGAPKSVNPNDIESLVSEMLTKREAESRRQSNISLVERKLAEKFGNDAAIHLDKKAKELGITRERLQSLASDSPQIVLDLLGVNRATTPAPTAVAPVSRINSAVKPEAGTTVRDQAYYDKMKSTDPKAYFSNETRTQMMKDAMARPDLFPKMFS